MAREADGANVQLTTGGCLCHCPPTERDHGLIRGPQPFGDHNAAEERGAHVQLAAQLPVAAELDVNPLVEAAPSRLVPRCYCHS
jgi:hypothetical protein